MKFKERVKQIKSKISQVYIAIKNKETPFLAKVLGGITLVYALSPIDLIPDFIPILGLLDDFIILPILIYFTIKLIPKRIWEESEELAKTIWQDGKPKKWYYAIPFVLVWLLLIYLIIKAFI